MKKTGVLLADNIRNKHIFSVGVGLLAWRGVLLSLFAAMLILAPIAAQATGSSTYTCPGTPLNSYPHFFSTGDQAKASDVTDNFDWFQKCPYFTGKVGIGTNAPQQMLHIAGNGSGGGNQTGVQVGDVGTGAGPLFLVHNNPTVAGNAYYNTAWLYGGGVGKPAFLDLSNGMHFFTSNATVGAKGTAISDVAERMTITSDGKVGIGTNNPLAMLEVVTAASRSFFISQGWLNTNTTRIGAMAAGGVTNIPLEIEGAPIQFVSGSSGSEIMRIASDGNLWIAGSYSNASDRRLKDHIAPLAYGLDAVMKLKPSSFQMKQGDGRTRLGFIAQEVQPVLPELIRDEVQQPGPNAKPGATPQSYLAMDYIGVIPVLTQSIQELKKEQDKMKQEIASLKVKGGTPLAKQAEEGVHPSPNAVATPISPLAPTLWALLGMAVGVIVTYAALRKRA